MAKTEEPKSSVIQFRLKTDHVNQVRNTMMKRRDGGSINAAFKRIVETALDSVDIREEIESIWSKLE